MLKVLPKVPGYMSFRQFGWPVMLPMNITVSVSYRCNSTCHTCDVWRKRSYQLTVEEWDKVFQSLGQAPYWFTFSGGEPFLRKETVDIILRAYERCRPAIINVPTNGLLTERIVESVRTLASTCTESNLVINLSLDGVAEEHDQIRGVPGNFAKSMETFRQLRALKEQYPNFTLGVHSVISNFNLHKIDELAGFVMDELQPDSYISEIAEERVELSTIDWDITPTPENYEAAISKFRQHSETAESIGRMGHITRALRHEYYKMVPEVLRQETQVLPCYAGWASCQISPDGDIWSCCVRAEPMGNVLEHNYDFKKAWTTARAKQIRESIKNKECHCPLANAAYSTMLHHPPTAVKVGVKVAASVAGDKLGEVRALFANKKPLPMVSQSGSAADSGSVPEGVEPALAKLPMLPTYIERSQKYKETTKKAKPEVAVSRAGKADE
jgi:MoaA/NifB/PqqE/SkfB family radical SAM enzyme